MDFRSQSDYINKGLVSASVASGRCGGGHCEVVSPEQTKPNLSFETSPSEARQQTFVLLLCSLEVGEGEGIKMCRSVFLSLLISNVTIKNLWFNMKLDSVWTNSNLLETEAWYMFCISPRVLLRCWGLYSSHKLFYMWISLQKSFLVQIWKYLRLASC